MARVESVRRIFPLVWFNAASTEGGRDALGWYHEKKDEARDIGLGPEHDWSSHGADAFGLLAIAFETVARIAKVSRRKIRNLPQIAMP